MYFPGVSGYVASSMYKKIGGENWAWNIVLTATLFAGNVLFCSGNTYLISSCNVYNMNGYTV